MGDYRVSVKINITGADGKERSIDWDINYSDDIPERINSAVIKLTEDSGFFPDTGYIHE